MLKCQTGEGVTEMVAQVRSFDRGWQFVRCLGGGLAQKRRWGFAFDTSDVIITLLWLVINDIHIQ